MEKSAIIQLIRDYLGFNVGLSEAVILRHMDIAQAKYEGGEKTLPLPWFLLNENYAVSTVSNSREILLPNNFIQFDEEWSLSSVDVDGGTQELCRVSQRNVVESVSVGRPKAYVLAASKIYLYPMPDKIYTIKMPYYAAGGKLSAVITSPWFTYFPRLIIVEALQSLGLATRDEGLLKLVIPMASVEQQNYLHRVEVMRNNQREIVMGSA